MIDEEKVRFDAEIARAARKFQHARDVNLLEKEMLMRAGPTPQGVFYAGWQAAIEYLSKHGPA